MGAVKAAPKNISDEDSGAVKNKRRRNFIMNKFNVKYLAADIVLLVLSVLLFVGTWLFFGACGPKEDGSWMNCHWAELVIIAVGAVLIVQSVLRFLFSSRDAKTAFSISALTTAVFTAFVPNRLIKLCMMNDMHCQAVMKPAVTVIAVIIALAAAVDIVIGIIDRKKEN